MKRKGWIVLFTALGVLSGCGQEKGEDVSTTGEELLSEEETLEIAVGRQMENVSCHDPQILLAEDGNYYMYGSHMVGVKSSELSGWEYFANGSQIFDNIFSGDLDAFAYVGKNSDGQYSVWAPDVVYNEAMQKYVMYFCTTSSYIKSNICFAVSDTPDGPFTYVDTILYSGFGNSDLEMTNLYEVLGEEADTDHYLEYGGYNNKDWPNCIDPSIFKDEEGRMWMVYGSWSGGIFLLEIDEQTGYPIHPEADLENGTDAYFGKHLIGGDHHSVEGANIFYDENSGYYYLFVSYGGLESDGGYQIRQYRSKTPDGTYEDAAGKTLGKEENHFDYGLKMMGNYQFPSLESAYMASGGQSVFRGKDGNVYITYHQRFDDGTEYHEPRVHRLYLNEEGWYVASPFAVNAEEKKAEGDTIGALEGTFYLVNHGTDISSKIHKAQKYEFFKDGTIQGEKETGSFTVKEDTGFVKVKFGEKEYDGVITETTDEAGNPVIVIMASGSANETIWCVQYK